MDIQQEILNIIRDKGAPSEEYERMISRQDLLSELASNGVATDDCNDALTILCNDGTLALDELNVYQYDFPAG